jgi:hypothetical protein
MTMKSNLVLVLACVVLAVGCGRRRPSVEELMVKVDSIKRAEQVEQLRRQVLGNSEASPLQVFYDSLNIQALPVSYSEDYVKYLPGFTPVPPDIKIFLQLEGKKEPKAMSLSDIQGERLLLLAADVADGQYELWLYSLDVNYYPVDQLMLYEPAKESETKIPQAVVRQQPYFSITSTGEINIVDYAGEDDAKGQLSTFVVDGNGMFVEKKPVQEAITP